MVKRRGCRTRHPQSSLLGDTEPPQDVRHRIGVTADVEDLAYRVLQGCKQQGPQADGEQEYGDGPVLE